MIACIGKNNRGRFLFEKLHQIDKRFVDLGVVEESRPALLTGFVKSVSWDLGQMKRDARFSPDYRRAMTKRSIGLIDALQDEVEAVIYWGATNMPVDPKRHRFPWYIVTDGPFDPNDSSYPVEWKPARWSNSYFADQSQIYHSCNHVFTLSEWARQKIIKVHGVSTDKVTKIGWGPLGCIGPPLKLPEGGKKVFLSVGSDWYRKGMDIVAEAGAIAAKHNEDIETIIIGEPNGLVIQAAKGVTLVPGLLPSTVVHSLMRQATAVVVASRFDASPHVIPEALQYGVRVIGNNVCGIPEMVEPQNLLDRLDAISLSRIMLAQSGAREENRRDYWQEAATAIVKTLATA